MNTKVTPEMKLIQLLLGRGVRSERQLRGIDWMTFEKFLSYHEIAPSIYVNIKPYLDFIPGGLRELLRNGYWHAVRSNILKDREYQRIFEAFQDKDTDVLPFKGVSFLNDIYEEGLPRPMNDIDLLVPERDYEKAEGILQGLGYKKRLGGLTEDYWRNKQCHVTFLRPYKNSQCFIVDLHWGLDFKRNGRLILPDIWKRIRDVETVEGKKIRLLSPEDALFSIALHQRRYGKALSLKYILDTKLLFRKYKDVLDLDYIAASSKKERMSSCLYFLLLQARLFFGSGDFDTLLDRLSMPRLKRNLMERFINDKMLSDSLAYEYKVNYLKTHFLLYDDYLEPAGYIMNIPLEQFTRFYDLEPYSMKARILYKLRFLSFLFTAIKVKYAE
ncbi:MAG: nucleotidyltransferase family protein [Candidatus Omnitrophica bacterium]|nr:nucleotidyltransferase family protein [Candidatus Omnitrophota bacterium]